MASILRALIVEDSEDDALLLTRELRRGGFEPHVERVDNEADLQTALTTADWDIVITDHNMPNFDASAAVLLSKTLRPDMPIIIVSGSIGENLAVAAMKAGAHDYIMKGNLARLAPAVARELRDYETRRVHREAEEMIRHMAFHDSLTGLMNRGHFDDQLKHALRDVRHGDAPHALLYLDLDQFKVVNDTCGHVAGDELLRQLALVLKKTIRDEDCLARLGGDEFGVLLKNCLLEQAQQVAKHLHQSINDFRFTWCKMSFTVGASIGVVPLTACSDDISGVLSAADMACYAAKELGRNRIHVYREDDAMLARRHGEMRWVSGITEALEKNRFVLYQQPIVSLNESKVGTNSSEFLLRLRDDNNRLILPGAFIPAAERYDLMPLLDRWVIGHAFEYLGRRCHGDRCRQNDLFFINLSGASLSDAGFFAFIRNKREEYNVPPGTVCFEITETAAIANLTNAVEFIEGIKREGFHFALDDFGAGLSSFSYLKAIPVDFVKIDGGFVRDLVSDAMDGAIVEAINSIAHVAGLRTIAEFVESEAVLTKLKRLGVDYAQGHFIGKPVALADQSVEQPMPRLRRI